MCFQWVNDKLKKMTCFDYGVLKVSVFSFALLITKFYPNIMSFDWRWYAAVFFVTYLYLIVRMFRK